MNNPTVVYIAGVGRSGSTILDLILGNNEGVESVGELANLIEVLNNNNEYCSCGTKLRDCRFWSLVVDEWKSRSGLFDLKIHQQLQNKYERIRSLPLLLSSEVSGYGDYTKYITSQESLYQSIFNVTRSNIIIDSSKKPIRSLSLLKMKSIDLKVIHIIRDGRGVVWSMMKEFKKHDKLGIQSDLLPTKSWKTSIKWVIINLIIDKIVKRRAGKSFICVKYEDLISHPENTLNNISDQFGDLCVKRSINKLRNSEPFSAHHIFSGNRLRMDKEIKLVPDLEWKHLLPKKDKRIFWAIAGKLSSGFGYSNQPILKI